MLALLIVFLDPRFIFSYIQNSKQIATYQIAHDIDSSEHQERGMISGSAAYLFLLYFSPFFFLIPHRGIYHIVVDLGLFVESGAVFEVFKRQSYIATRDQESTQPVLFICRVPELSFRNRLNLDAGWIEISAAYATSLPTPT